MYDENGVSALAVRTSALGFSAQHLSEQVWLSANEIDAEAWEQVRLPSDSSLDRRLLQATETSLGPTCQFRYVLYRDSVGEPAAIAVLCTFEVDIGVLTDDPWARWILDRLRHISRKLVTFRIHFCGLPLSGCESALRFAEGADTTAVLKRLDQTMRRVAREDRVKIIVLKEFTDAELTQLKLLEALGYRRADSLPTNLIHPNSGSFEGFLHELGWKRRGKINVSRKKFTANGLRLVTTSDYSTIERLYTPETHQMYEFVFQRSATKFEHLTREFFLEMARQLGDSCEFTFAMEGDRVRGFVMSLWFGREYRSLYIGYDESINEKSHVYFNLLFQAVANGTQHQASTIDLGQNSDYVKHVKLGAVQARRSMYVMAVKPIAKWVITNFFDQLFPAHPFFGEANTTNGTSEFLAPETAATSGSAGGLS
ncbi:GNAT family N-acetyltransferase [Schlesneria paludicola]|uniref:GNAT family N-acetyltransferase n=1 Tax=Schlesneria paludicola TaxID=360056 RepID=UPI00029AA8B9|nr:GNAT family N-acetyltransferase [Schlesneria paludicola]